MTSSPTTAPAAPTAHRRDVQGLRALAVLVVVADHLWHWPAGGFIGVDVFFVVSGFVITGLLLRELDRTGRICFRSFYVRRAKRLLPAGLTVLVTTLVVAHQLFSPLRFRETVSDVVAAALFSANWRTASAQTDYFAADGPVSPVQHFWSLSVEEQFYVAWPLVLLLAVVVCRRRPDVLVGAVVLASLAWAWHESASNPTVAYFSTFSRAWELGAGALVAVWALRAGPLPARAGRVLRVGGLTAVLASLAVVTPDSPFPAPWALLPVLGTAALLVGGHGADLGTRGPLTHRCAVRTGDLSYALYLWHFPVIVLAGELVDLDRPLTALAVLGVIAALSVASFFLVEDPLRRATWSRPRLACPSRSRLAGLLGVPVVLATLIGAVQPGSASAPAGAMAPGVGAPVLGTAGLGLVGPAQGALRARIAQALDAQTWPAGLDRQLRAPLFPADVERCSHMGPVPAGCAWGRPGATRTAVIVGDSVAVGYVGPLREVLAQRGWRLVSYAAGGCTFTATRTRSSDPDITRRCPQKKEEAVAAIRRLRPDLLVVTNSYGGRIADATGKALTPEQWRTSQQQILDRVVPSAGRLLLLAPPTAHVDLERCYSRVSRPADCVSRVSQVWYDTAKVEAGLAWRAGGAFVDTRPLYCDQRGLCPSVVAGTAVKLDPSHTAPAWSRRYVPALDELLAASGVLQRLR